ncbi:histidine utilization repressor [Maricaulis sp. CAU 1757]
MRAWPSELTLDGDGPVYDQVKRAVAQLIRSGDWPPGTRIPSEADMVTHLGTSRMTINRALRELTEEGLIVRRRRAGSFVAQPEPPSALLRIVDMSHAIPKAGQAYGYDCQSSQTVPADDEIARRMQLPRGARLQALRCLHTADGLPLELEERWINLDLLPEAAHIDFNDVSPGSWLLKAAPWTEAEHTVSAINADEALAEALDIAPGAACLVLERRTFHDNVVVTYARLTHPGERHSMTERFAPGRH